MRMNHAAAEDLYPAGALAEAAAFSAALEAGYVHLRARLCEREMMGTELGLCIRPEELFCKYLQRSLKIGAKEMFLSMTSPSI